MERTRFLVDKLSGKFNIDKRYTYQERVKSGYRKKKGGDDSTIPEF